MTRRNMAEAKVLFVCVENAGRSQMAEGFAKHFGKGHLEDQVIVLVHRTITEGYGRDK